MYSDVRSLQSARIPDCAHMRTSRTVKLTVTVPPRRSDFADPEALPLTRRRSHPARHPAVLTLGTWNVRHTPATSYSSDK